MKQNDDPTQEAARRAGVEAEGHGKIIRIDKGRIKEHLSGVVLEAVEETPNALLNAGGGGALRGATLRTQRGAGGHAGREL